MQQSQAFSSLKVCIVILNWQGQKYLSESLPSIIEAINTFSGSCSIILLDNNEDDDSDRVWVREHFPSVQVIQAPRNDFLYSYNWLFEKLEEDVVILLNNDVKVDPQFITPLIQHFRNSDVFAVSSRAYDWDGENLESGPHKIMCHRGWFYYLPDFDKQETSYTLFACGGYMAVDRKKFLDLGGFDYLFYPAYGEDLDLCYRAWLKGWQSIYEPESVVYHLKSASWDNTDNTGNSKYRYLNLKAAFLFQFKYLYSFPQSIFYGFYLCYLLTQKIIKNDSVWLSAFRDACFTSKGKNHPNLDLKKQKELHKIFAQCL